MHLKKPLYSEDGDSVKITFYFQHEKIIEISDEANIIELAKTKKEITISDMVNYLEISRNTATRKINNLIKQHKMIRIGKGPATKFKSIM